MFTSIELLTENLKLRYDALLAVEKNRNNFRGFFEYFFLVGMGKLRD